MRVRFDQIRVDTDTDAGEQSLAERADRIIMARRVGLAAAAVGAGDGECNKIVAKYTLAPLNLVILNSNLFDASVLTHDKKAIKLALVECAKQEALSESEVEYLGQMYFYLSYFRVGLAEREGEPISALLEEQRAEGVAFLLEWQSAMASRKRSGFFKSFSSWLKH